MSGIGDITAKKLITKAGSATALFKKESPVFERVRIGSTSLREKLRDSSLLRQAEKEIEFSLKNNIRILHYNLPAYPRRLKECADAPVLLFCKGPADLDSTRIISIVGTRKASHYGKELTETLVSGLKDCNALIISGLAYGIDIYAHKAALKNGIPTAGIVAHGLDEVYPAQHWKEANEMIQQGGALVSDFPSGTKLEKENFPKRNRIIAGLSDAVVVVEARETGGALITADIANSYSREVFAFPGRVNDMPSAGCNGLIKNNQAALICSADDLIKAMNWDDKKGLKQAQIELFKVTDPDEQILVDIIQNEVSADIDSIVRKSGFNSGKTAMLLLNLELSGTVKSLPGKKYRLAQ